MIDDTPWTLREDDDEPESPAWRAYAAAAVSAAA